MTALIIDHAATFHGARRPLTTATLLAAWASSPLLTLKVIGGIHWEALRLWRKGMRLVERPPAPPLLSFESAPAAPQAGRDRAPRAPAAPAVPPTEVAVP